MAPHEEFNTAAVRSALIGTRFSAHLQHFPQVDSTSTLLLAAAANGAPEGTVYLADEQTAGRGRSGHAWHSAPGEGLYLSALAKPSLHLREALWISLATGLAAKAAIQNITGLAVDIRWPNDLLLGEKKLGGILVETAIEPATKSATKSQAQANLRYAVIGIGINLNHSAFPADLTDLATSLLLATGAPIHRQHLALALLRALDYELTLLESRHSNLLARFTAASTWVQGKPVHVPEQGGYTGTTAGLDPQGFLLVDADDGKQRTVLSGGVRAVEKIRSSLQ
jgi:BirA family biotin operon repressor/biotin-[acetyl-CoA-carboxylase] ligase